MTSCGRLANEIYCFPTKLLWGFNRPGTNFEDGHVTLEMPIPASQQDDCLGNYGDDKHSLSIFEPRNGDTAKDFAMRVKQNRESNYITPSRAIRWNALNCSGSTYPNGWICIIDGDKLDEGMTILSCNGEGTVPVPHCTHEHFTKKLHIKTHYRVECAIHWQAIQAEMHATLSAGLVTARSLEAQ